MKRNRVVVTGMGVVSSVGLGLERFWEGLTTGRNGISRIKQFDTTGFRSQMAAEVLDFNPEEWIDEKSVGRMDRFTQFGLAASTMALSDAGLSDFDYDGNRVGVIIGSGIGGATAIEEGHDTFKTRGPRALSPFFVSKVLINMAACIVSINYGFKGPLSAPSVACSTGANAIGDALRILQMGDADVMLAGGCEACVTPLPFAGFCATRSMSTRNDCPESASRPFDKNRDGFVMGEGAGIVVLENLEHALKRNARIYAEVVGYGNTSDAFHITAPEPTGDGMKRVIRAALDDANAKPEEVDYINAHGTSTTLNDKIECAAIEEVFGTHAKRLKVSSIKSMIGHLLAAAGAVEMVSTVMTVYNNKLPPTINYEEPDPDCALDFVTNGAEDCNVGLALSNSFGFGGGNACLAVREYER